MFDVNSLQNDLLYSHRGSIGYYMDLVLKRQQGNVSLISARLIQTFVSSHIAPPGNTQKTLGLQSMYERGWSQCAIADSERLGRRQGQPRHLHPSSSLGPPSMLRWCRPHTHTWSHTFEMQKGWKTGPESLYKCVFCKESLTQPPQWQLQRTDYILAFGPVCVYKHTQRSRLNQPRRQPT